MSTDTAGGVWSYSLELARALTRRGVDVTLATLGDPPTIDQRREVAALERLRLRVSRYRLEWMRDPWQDVSASGAWLLELESEVRPDVVHLNGYAQGALPFEAPVVVVAHSCVLSWWRAVKGCDAPPEWERYAAAVRAGLRGADAVVAPSAAMLAALRACHGPVPGARVLPNGVDPGALGLAVPGRRALVLAAGRVWDEAKALSDVAAVAPDLPWPVAIAGAVPHAGDRRGGAAAHGGPGDAPAVEGAAAGARRRPSIGPAVRLGRLPRGELARWLRRAGIFAHPARYEPFGLAPLEAALAGCALVLGDIASLREVWGDAAAYVPPGDLHTLRATLTRLALESGERDELARKARLRAGSYSAARMAEGYLGLYRELCAAGAPGRDRDRATFARGAVGP